MKFSDNIWQERVEAHHCQSARARQANGWIDDDHWGHISSLFMADPLRTHDQALKGISGAIDRETTVIDVGGGAGRYALPLALVSNHVTVIEQSPAMCLSLHTIDSGSRSGIIPSFSGASRRRRSRFFVGQVVHLR